MKIYTSYFAQIRNFPHNLVGLSTCRYNPKWLNPGRSQNDVIWLDIPPLKPGKSCDGLCNGKCAPKHPNDCDFLKTYRKQLDKIDFKMFIKHLEVLAQTIQLGENLKEVNFALLVFERWDNPCSERVIIQQWFKDNGMEIEEWKK